MAALGIQGNGESGSAITEEAIEKTLNSLENDLQRVGGKWVSLVLCRVGCDCIFRRINV